MNDASLASGRIVKGVGGLYMVECEGGVYACSARGLFRKRGETPLVGDFAEILVENADKRVGRLQTLLERKNRLIRPSVANVDLAVVVFSIVSPCINLDLLDRLLLLIEKSGLDILLCANKTDLATDGEYARIAGIYETAGFRLVRCSVRTGEGMGELRAALRGKASVLAGPSGVGKSSLVNAVFPHLSAETGEISLKTERGKHTTRHAEFLRIGQSPQDGYIVDTPGFTSLENSAEINRDAHLYFREFAPFLGKCRFNDCLHVNEPDCAVKKVIGGAVARERYESYLRIVGASKNPRDSVTF